MIQTQIDELLDIVAQKAVVERNKLLPEAKLADLNIASLDMVEVLFALEEKLGIELPLNANVNLGQLSTLGDLIDLVDKQMNLQKNA